eukprot:2414554-Amphidinium_carterae.1
MFSLKTRCEPLPAYLSPIQISETQTAPQKATSISALLVRSVRGCCKEGTYNSVTKEAKLVLFNVYSPNRS